MFKPSSAFTLVALFALSLIGVAGCNGASAPFAPGSAQAGRLTGINVVITPTPDPKLLYAVHSGVFSIYSLPLKPNAKPLRTLEITPGHPTTSQAIAVDTFGKVAIATTKQIRIYAPPITTFAPSAAKLVIQLGPALTEIGPTGADLVDIEFDPNDNLWLLNNLGGDITELPAPLSKQSVANINIQFGVTGTKTAGFPTLIQARFDTGAGLYVLADNSNVGPQLFKVGFPYAKPPSTFYNLDLAQANFIDPSQFPNGPPSTMTGGAILAQYTGPLSTSPPLKPTPQPHDVLAQFNLPIMAVNGVVPNASVDTRVGAIVADPPRDVFYALDALDGSLDEYALPLTRNAKPKIALPCSGGAAICSNQIEHLFFAP